MRTAHSTTRPTTAGSTRLTTERTAAATRSLGPQTAGPCPRPRPRPQPTHRPPPPSRPACSPQLLRPRRPRPRPRPPAHRPGRHPPKQAKPALPPALRAVVAAKPSLSWSPEQISGWPRRHFAADPSMRISHEAICLSLHDPRRRKAIDRTQKLRTARPMRQPKGRLPANRAGHHPRHGVDQPAPGRGRRPGRPRAWEGDQVTGTRPSALGHRHAGRTHQLAPASPTSASAPDPPAADTPPTGRVSRSTVVATQADVVPPSPDDDDGSATAAPGRHHPDRCGQGGDGSGSYSGEALGTHGMMCREAGTSAQKWPPQLWPPQL